MLLKMRRAQGATEYAIFIAAVLAGLLALQVYYQRAVKGNMKGRADSIGEQFNNEEGLYTRESRSAAARISYTNTDGAQGAWSRTDTANETQSTAIKGSDTAWLSNIGNVVAADKHTSGEVSSTEYVNIGEDDWGSEAQATDFGVHGVASLGEIDGGGSSVWEDAGLDE